MGSRASWASRRPRRGRRGACVRCFFFQAEDGIRDYKVTGVQTCALPICWAQTGGDGTFRVDGVEAGAYDVSVSAMSWGRRGTRLNVRPVRLKNVTAPVADLEIGRAACRERV